MSYGVNWITKVISIPTVDLTLVSGDRYSLDMSDFLAEVRRLEWEFAAGLWAPSIVDHTNTRFDVAGVNYAPFDDLLNDYTVQITGSATRVDLLGSNNDIVDVLIATGVSIVPSNSAGLQIVLGGSGVTEQDKLDISDRVWDEQTSEHQITGSTGKALGDVSGGSSPETIAAAVWVHATRSLTTFGTLVADVWSYVTRLLTGSGLTAPEQAELTGIKERTDNLPDNPADVSDIPTATENAIELLDKQNAP